MAKQPYRLTKIDEIKPYDRNPRIIPQAAVDAVAKSIQAFGFRQPIVVDGNGVILAGHTRYRAALQLGLSEVPVVWQTDISAIQAQGYRIADNKTAELSAWDRDALDTEVRDIAAQCDADLGALGLADWELERILQETQAARLPEEEAAPMCVRSQDLSQTSNVVPLNEFPILLNSESPQFRTMTFTLTQEQYDTCAAAVHAALRECLVERGENKNGAAFSFICAQFNAKKEAYDA